MPTSTAIAKSILSMRFGFLLLVWHAFPAHAGLIEFHDRALWFSSVGEISGAEDFESFTEDAQFRTQSLAIAGLNVIGGPTGNDENANLIDVAPFVFNGFENINGSTSLVGDADPRFGTTVNMVLEKPMVAWGATFKGLNPSTVLTIFDLNGFVLGTLSSIHTVEQEFLGFHSDNFGSASRLEISHPGPTNDFFRMDDMVFVYASVPEPSTGVLLGIGIAALIILTRARTRRPIKKNSFCKPVMTAIYPVPKVRKQASEQTFHNLTEHVITPPSPDDGTTPSGNGRLLDGHPGSGVAV